ncbi:hypothetical protein [Aeromonas salmonicida]|uniref:hypothetical protein n=1 Tax=Aeromonas salmonicida TaxID=645 RepID=UPI00285A3FC5|nr:hypothetical protein [Aeromonas salmonicida]MDR7021048.1 hypothetical protein [Aeromonas salmonicida]
MKQGNIIQMQLTHQTEGKMKATITIKDYDALLTHVADRFVEFYVIYNLARLHEPNKVAALRDFDSILKTIFNDLHYSDDEMVRLKIINETLDSFQLNFSYDRILNPSLLTKSDKTKHDALASIISGLKKDHIIKNEFEYIRKDFHYLLWLRAADIVNALSPSAFLEKIARAKTYLNEIKKRAHLNYEDLPIDTTLNFTGKDAELSPLCDVLTFYPEKLRNGIFYIYPQINELPYNATLAITCHFNADKHDITEALEDYPYQFEKFKNYYHLERSDFTAPVEIEKLRPLLQKNKNSNRYIKQLNSIEKSIRALIYWEKVHLEHMSEKDALNATIPSGCDSNYKTDVKRKIQELSAAINKWHEYYVDINCL